MDWGGQGLRVFRAGVGVDALATSLADAHPLTAAALNGGLDTGRLEHHGAWLSLHGCSGLQIHSQHLVVGA